MHTSFRRIKRFILIVAGTAALIAATAAPMAMADIPTGGSGQPPASPDQCDMYHDWYDTDINTAGVAIAVGNLTRGLEYAGQAARDVQVATERGCDPITWAAGGRPVTVAPPPPVAPVPVAK